MRSSAVRGVALATLILWYGLSLSLPMGAGPLSYLGLTLPRKRDLILNVGIILMVGPRRTGVGKILGDAICPFQIAS